MSVRELKIGEYGKTIFVNAGVDLSTATSLEIEFIKPSGTVETVAATLGNQDVTGKDQNCNDVTFLANQYTFYIIPAGFIDESGCWLYRALNELPGLFVPGDQGEFTVTE